MLEASVQLRHKIRSGGFAINTMQTMKGKEKDSAKHASHEKPHAAIPLPERFERPEKKEDNSPQKTVGTKTPGVKKDEDLPVAMERKARLDGQLPKPKK